MVSFNFKGVCLRERRQRLLKTYISLEDKPMFRLYVKRLYIQSVFLLGYERQIELAFWENSN